MKIDVMDLLTMMYTVQQIAQTYDKTLELSLEQYNNYLDIAQKELFKELADGYSVGRGMGSSSIVDSALAPLVNSASYTSTNWADYTSGGSSFYVPCLVFNLESGVYRVLSASAVDSASEHPDKSTKIDIVTANEAVERLNNSITYPTADYPVMYISKPGGATQFVACVMPNGFTRIMVNYLITPPTPSLILTYSNDVPTQSGSSVDLYFHEPYKMNIISIILKYLGVGVGNDQVRAFVEQQKINEK